MVVLRRQWIDAADIMQRKGPVAFLNERDVFVML